MRISVATAVAADWSGPDWATAELSTGGETVPVLRLVAPSGGGPAGDILFHGRGSSGDYTRTNIYWLRPGSAGAGADMRSNYPLPLADSEAQTAAAGGPEPRAAASEPRTFREVLHLERDTVYYQSMHRSEGPDRWMWGDALVAPRGRVIPVDAPGLVGGTATLTFTLQGYSSHHMHPDHRLAILVNGEPAGMSEFDGKSELSLVVQSSRFLTGANRLEVRALDVEGVPVNAFFVNRVAVAYDRSLAAVDDRLDFALPAGQLVRVDGFTAPQIKVWDVTVLDQPVNVPVEIIGSEQDGWSVRFHSGNVEAQRGSPIRRFVAFSLDAARPPDSVAATGPNSIDVAALTEEGFDYLVIAPSGFHEALEPLLEHRTYQGLKVAFAPIDAVYDTYSHGVFDPGAIRGIVADLLPCGPCSAGARGAPSGDMPAVKFLLLVGEANLDYRGGYAEAIGPRSPTPNLVPSMQIDLAAGGAATSDAWYADLDSDEVPDVAYGRLPAASIADVRAAVDKILAFERWRADSQTERIVLVADDDSPAFESTSETLVASAPPELTVDRLYAGRFPRENDLTAAIANAASVGTLAVNFVGHGNVDLWGPWPGGPRIFDNRAVSQMRSSREPPILTTASCMNGWFSHPLIPVALGEMWLNHPVGGGSAVVAPTVPATLNDQTPLLAAFYAGLWRDDGAPTLGELFLTAQREALAAGGSSDVVYTFALLGDPAMRLRPPRHAPSGRRQLLFPSLFRGKTT